MTNVKRWIRALGQLPEIKACRQQTSQWKSLTLAYLRLRSVRYPSVIRLRTGQKITLHEPTDLIVFWLVFVRRHYPVRPSDKTIVDLGANIGIFTLYASREAPHCTIVAVEPFPDTCSRLIALINQNGLQNRVIVLSCAVGVASSKGNMDTSDAIPSQYRRLYSEKTLALNPRHRNMVEQSETGIEVQTLPLHDILDRASAREVDAMKMNIHGSEYDVLLSSPIAAIRRCKRIIVQYHEMPAGSGLTKAVLFQHLAEADFALLQDRVSGSSGLAEFALKDSGGRN